MLQSHQFLNGWIWIIIYFQIHCQNTGHSLQNKTYLNSNYTRAKSTIFIQKIINSWYVFVLLQYGKRVIIQIGSWHMGSATQNPRCKHGLCLKCDYVKATHGPLGGCDFTACLQQKLRFTVKWHSGIKFLLHVVIDTPAARTWTNWMNHLQRPFLSAKYLLYDGFSKI